MYSEAYLSLIFSPFKDSFFEVSKSKNLDIIGIFRLLSQMEKKNGE